MEQRFSSFQFQFVGGVAKRGLIYYIQFRSFAYCTLDDDVQSWLWVLTLLDDVMQIDCTS